MEESNLSAEQQAQVDQHDKIHKHTPTHKENMERFAKIDGEKEEIIKDLEGLKIGQEDMSKRLDEGAEVFKEHKAELIEVRGEVSEVKKQVDDLKTTLLGGISEIKSDIKEDKNREAVEKQKKENESLKDDIRGMIAEKRKTDNRIWDIAKLFVGAALTIVVAWYLVASGIK